MTSKMRSNNKTCIFDHTFDDVTKVANYERKVKEFHSTTSLYTLAEIS